MWCNTSTAAHVEGMSNNTPPVNLTLWHQHAYLTVMSSFPNGIEPVSGVCRCFSTHTADRLQVLQTEKWELLPVFCTSLWIILASVFPKGLAGLVQHRAHHCLIHGRTAPAQRAVVWIPTALCVPAVSQTGFTESVSACQHHRLVENIPTNRTGKVILQMSTSGGHSSSQDFGDRAGREATPMPMRGYLILTSGISVNTLAPRGISPVMLCCIGACMLGILK